MMCLLLCAVVLVSGVVTPSAARAVAGEAVTAAAVWHPAPGFLAEFHAQCDERRGTAFSACFAEIMAEAGASQAALDFTHRLGNAAYLTMLDPTGGPVSVAHLLYPFRANENDAWILVNGAPPLIDVDNPRNLNLAQLQASQAYREIRRRYPNASFWPGERGTGSPEVRPDGREIVVGYLLRDLCHACAVVGHVRFAFEFDANGKFLGTRLKSVIAADK